MAQLHDSGQVGALSSDVIVTPAMIEVGALRLLDELAVGDPDIRSIVGPYAARDIVAKVFGVMSQAKVY